MIEQKYQCGKMKLDYIERIINNERMMRMFLLGLIIIFAIWFISEAVSDAKHTHERKEIQKRNEEKIKDLLKK